MAEGLGAIAKGQLDSLTHAENDVSALVPSNWRLHVVDEPDEKWIIEELLQSNLSTNVAEVWTRAFATFKQIKDSETNAWPRQF